MNRLPNGWSPEVLGKLADFVMGQAPPGADCNKSGMGTPFVKAGEFGNDRPLIREWTTRPLKHALASDVLICVVGATAGKINLGADCAIGRSVAAIRPIEALDQQFLYDFLATKVLDLRAGSTGSAQGVIGKDDLAEIEIGLPPVSEQRRIVAKIDSLKGKSKRGRDHLDHIPRLVEKYKQAMLVAAFRGDLTLEWRLRPENRLLVSPLPHVREQRAAASLAKKRGKALETLPMPSGQLPGIPSAWMWACIEEIASDEPMSIQSGPFGSSLLHSEFTKAGKLVVGIDNVQDGYFSPGSQHRVSERKFDELRQFQARPEDVLITVMATIGRVCVVPKDVEPAIITKHVYRITVDRRISLPEYVAFGLRGSEVALEHMGANIRGQTRPGLNGQIVKSTFLPVPPLMEQIEIVRRIEERFGWIDRLALEATNARKLINRLDQAVLARAFRGALVEQDPADEPASVLLERIRAERGTAPKTRRKQR
jgi:type I restriction enzyme S subunit